jgi:hypothetical protein
METKNKHIFWEALVIAIFLFGVGMFFGYFIELNRTSQIISLYQETEINLLDTKIQDNLILMSNPNCELFFNETLSFANRIYDEAKLLERYEDSSQLSEGIVFQHKKYDLLRANLWINTLNLKERCNSNIITLVYFYEYDAKNLALLSKQDTFSRKLTELRNEHGDKVVLIPIAGNLGVNSINYLKAFYNITDYPTILVDEKFKISELQDLDELDTYVDKA